MRRFKFSKLVRDKIVDEIISVGNNPNWKVLSDIEYIRELKNKILEEALEVPKCDNEVELIKELADIQEVIDNLLDALKISKEQFKQTQDKKNEKVGSFKKKLYIEEVETGDEETEWVKYYLLNSDKYTKSK